LIPFFFHPHLILLPSSPFIMQRASGDTERVKYLSDLGHRHQRVPMSRVLLFRLSCALHDEGRRGQKDEVWINALGIAVQPEDLAKPSAAFVQTMYAALLDALIAVKVLPVSIAY
jgi:hypothetical protein